MTLIEKAENARWEAESDARTITESVAIQADAKRLAAAQKAAKRLEKEEKEKAAAMGKIADGTWPMNYKYDNTGEPIKK